MVRGVLLPLERHADRASLGAYLATTDDDGVQLHQYASSTVRARLAGGDVVLRVRTRYPDDGVVEVTVVEAPAGEWALSLRVPAWADGASVTDGGATTSVRPGYASVRRAFAAGDVVRLELPVRARWTWPDPRVDAVRGQVAVERGPVVMCLESVDLGSDVAGVQVHTGADPVDEDGRVLVPTSVVDLEDTAWPYGEHPGAGGVSGRRARGLVPLVPYHDWANRGPSTMRVWLPTAP